MLHRPARTASAPPTGTASAVGSTRATTSSSRWTPTSPTTRPCSRPCSATIEDGADVRRSGRRYVPGGSTPTGRCYRRALSALRQPLRRRRCSASASATPRRASGPTGPTCSRDIDYRHDPSPTATRSRSSWPTGLSQAAARRRRRSRSRSSTAPAARRRCRRRIMAESMLRVTWWGIRSAPSSSGGCGRSPAGVTGVASAIDNLPDRSRRAADAIRTDRFWWWIPWPWRGRPGPAGRVGGLGGAGARTASTTRPATTASPATSPTGAATPTCSPCATASR